LLALPLNPRNTFNHSVSRTIPLESRFLTNLPGEFIETLMISAAGMVLDSVSGVKWQTKSGGKPA